MRTPGNDFELATGFLHSEGMIRHIGQIRSMGRLSDGSANIVVVELDRELQPRQLRTRAESAGGRDSSNGRRRRVFQFGRRHRGTVRHDADRLPEKRAIQCLHGKPSNRWFGMNRVVTLLCLDAAGGANFFDAEIT
jgi:formate dehydrogenase assembly factor FdhD